jgi:hypothetical protein
MPNLSRIAAPALLALALGGCLNEPSLNHHLYDKLPAKPANQPLAAQAPALTPPEPALPLRDPNAPVTVDPSAPAAPQLPPPSKAPVK